MIGHPLPVLLAVPRLSASFPSVLAVVLHVCTPDAECRGTWVTNRAMLAGRSRLRRVPSLMLEFIRCGYCDTQNPIHMAKSILICIPKITSRPRPNTNKQNWRAFVLEFTMTKSKFFFGVISNQASISICNKHQPSPPCRQNRSLYSTHSQTQRRVQSANARRNLQKCMTGKTCHVVVADDSC